ncbi:MAG: hypothetical protein RL094_241 [Candidatus Parcubacteria bacterium]|jgi:hypothetical protein
MNNKILFVCLSSYQPANTSFRQRYNRQELYAVALWNLIQQTKGVADICVVENTTESITSFENNHSRTLVGSNDVKYKFLINNNALGSKNKGAGEFQMCMAVLDRLGDQLKQYDWVVYYTSRHILYKLPDFTQLLTNSTDDIVISNPDYILPDGTMLHAAPGNYNDMLFAMKPALFKEYCLSMNPEKLVEKRMNSEAHLYHFVEEHKAKGAKIKELRDLWLARYDYAMQHIHLVSKDMKSYTDFALILDIYKQFYIAFPALVPTKPLPQNGDTLNLETYETKPSFFAKLFSKFSHKPHTLRFLKSEYLYDIEPTWVQIEKALELHPYTNVAFPDTASTEIYKNRLQTLFAHKALGK